MRFTIEQIAIAPTNPAAARKLLEEMGAVTWAEDHVVATGEVFGEPMTNEANLAFNYELISGKEFEILDYTAGPNWVDKRLGRNVVTHLGMHCSAAELDQWRAFFAERGIRVSQEVNTDSHTNPVIAGKRKYTYAIFDTKDILGVDLKFIVRHLLDEA